VLDKGTGHEKCEIQDRLPLARASDSRGARRHPLVSRMEPWIPLLEGRFPIPIQHAGPDLQGEMRPARGPGHLLLLAEAFAGYLIHGPNDATNGVHFNAPLTLRSMDTGSPSLPANCL
jgi:hypothetical protein